jgi:hypothetical protein
MGFHFSCQLKSGGLCNGAFPIISEYSSTVSTMRPTYYFSLFSSDFSLIFTLICLHNLLYSSLTLSDNQNHLLPPNHTYSSSQRREHGYRVNKGSSINHALRPPGVTNRLAYATLSIFGLLSSSKHVSRLIPGDQPRSHSGLLANPLSQATYLQDLRFRDYPEVLAPILSLSGLFSVRRALTRQLT